MWTCYPAGRPRGEIRQCPCMRRSRGVDSLDFRVGGLRLAVVVVGVGRKAVGALARVWQTIRGQHDDGWLVCWRRVIRVLNDSLPMRRCYHPSAYPRRRRSGNWARTLDGSTMSSDCPKGICVGSRGHGRLSLPLVRGVRGQAKVDDRSALRNDAGDRTMRSLPAITASEGVLGIDPLWSTRNMTFGMLRVGVIVTD